MSGVRFQPFKAQLAWKTELNQRFTLFHFELIEPNLVNFKAGQYMLVQIPATGHQRSYSIASPPSLNHAVEMLVDLSPQGPGTRYLSELQSGDEVKMTGPLGSFTVPERNTSLGQAEKELIFIATGSGIAPFKGMLEDLLITKNDDRPMKLLWGMRYETDQFWYDDFGILASEHQNFNFEPVLSRPSENWQLHKGYVTDALSIQEDFSERGFYLCGSNAMIQDVRHLLTERGVPPEHIHNESFF
jgi:NAD(P)H-flavin reductase